ncbi:phenoloxidase-activating factor 3-like [Chironomus tepperi]|uniref:phenoloxidase-activating factor 3-like n=1 Tax=Chironomus tepperi TaxID=113505 RepID=UPI00391F385E
MLFVALTDFKKAVTKMVLHKNKLIILILFAFVKKSLNLTAASYVHCNTEKVIPIRGTQLIYFSEPGNTRTTCEYVVKSPTDSYISVELYHNLTGSGSVCSGQYLEVSPNGDPHYRSAMKYCGLRAYYNPLKFKTIGNEVRFRVVSNDLKRTVQIKLQAWPITGKNCSCSWNPSMRIANGQSTAATTFVGNAVLKTTSNKFNEAICGATIVSFKYSITAAHCITNARAYGLSKVLLHVGRQNVTADVYADTAFSEQYNIALAITHPRYNPQTKANDIGYIKTTRDIRFSRGVGPACISFPYQTHAIPSGTTLTAIGFGGTEFAIGARIDTKSWILQSVTLTVNQSLASGCNQIQKVCCQGYLRSNGERGDTCQRDSGGGIYAYINNLFYLMALTSEGVDCGMRNSYSINVHVPNYISWIKQVMGSELLCNR